MQRALGGMAPGAPIVAAHGAGLLYARLGENRVQKLVRVSGHGKITQQYPVSSPSGPIQQVHDLRALDRLLVLAGNQVHAWSPKAQSFQSLAGASAMPTNLLGVAGSPLPHGVTGPTWWCATSPRPRTASAARCRRRSVRAKPAGWPARYRPMAACWRTAWAQA